MSSNGHHSNTPSHAAPPPPTSRSRKRKQSTTTTTGTRGVANLTPDQLAKKRANDREAQRAIRERTKIQIETLERRIEQLTSQQPYQDLQEVVRQKEALEAENADIKRRLALALSILQPLLDGCTADILSPTQRDALPATPSLNSITSAASCNGDQLARLSLPFPGPTVPPTPILPMTVSPSHNLWPDPLAPASTPALGPSNLTPTVLPANAINRNGSNIAQVLTPITPDGTPPGYFPDGRPDTQTIQAQARPRPRRTGPSLPADSHITLADPYGQTLPRNNNNSHTTSLQTHYFSPTTTITDPTIPSHLPLPQNSPPTCPLDRLLLDFHAERRQRAADGTTSPLDLLGPPYPSFHCLLHPHRAPYSHPVSRFFTDIISTFPDLATPPEKVAVLYIMYLLIRFLICPTAHHRDRLPDWYRPTPTQLYTPHPVWVDHIPWPRMRDRLVLAPAECYPFDDFFIPLTGTLSVNWPYGGMETLVIGAGREGGVEEEMVLNPVFERHLRDLGNWTLGTAFAQAFPALADTLVIRDVVRGG